jgi:hypothetical protein
VPAAVAGAQDAQGIIKARASVVSVLAGVAGPGRPMQLNRKGPVW